MNATVTVSCQQPACEGEGALGGAREGGVSLLRLQCLPQLRNKRRLHRRDKSGDCYHRLLKTRVRSSS